MVGWFNITHPTGVFEGNFSLFISREHTPVVGVSLWTHIVSAVQMSLIRRPRNMGLTPFQVYQAGRAAYNIGSRAYKQYKRARSAPAARSSGGGSSAPLTGQFDYKTDFKRRRLGKRQRRRQKFRRRRARKAWKRAKLSAANTTHLLKQSAFTLTSVENQSNSLCYGLYGINGSGTQYNSTGDVGAVFNEMDSSSWALANAPDSTSYNHKLYFQHGTMEITIKNTGTVDALIEAYFIRGRRPVNTNWLDPAHVYDRGFRKQAVAQNPNPTLLPDPNFESGLTFNIVGTTPFQCAEFCKDYSIYKRQKFRLPPGNEINIVVSDPRPRSFGMVESRPIMTDRRYHGILFQQQGSPASGDPPVLAQATQVTYLAVRRYRFKMVRDNMTTDALDTTATT